MNGVIIHRNPKDETDIVRIEFISKYGLIMSVDYLLTNKLRSDWLPISKWDVVKVTNMSKLFKGRVTSDEQNARLEGIGQWNVEHVTNMDEMFAGCTHFNQDISGWDLKNVNSYRDAFKDCSIQETYMPTFPMSKEKKRLQKNREEEEDFHKRELEKTEHNIIEMMEQQLTDLEKERQDVINEFNRLGEKLNDLQNDLRNVSRLIEQYSPTENNKARKDFFQICADTINIYIDHLKQNIYVPPVESSETGQGRRQIRRRHKTTQRRGLRTHGGGFFRWLGKKKDAFNETLRKRKEDQENRFTKIRDDIHKRGCRTKVQNEIIQRCRWKPWYYLRHTQSCKAYLSTIRRVSDICDDLFPEIKLGLLDVLRKLVDLVESSDGKLPNLGIENKLINIISSTTQINFSSSFISNIEKIQDNIRSLSFTASGRAKTKTNTKRTKKYFPRKIKTRQKQRRE
jgi:surface protein